MFRQALISAAVVLLFSAWPVEAQDVINSTWVGGEWGNWGNPSNWDPPMVPDGNEFVVTIDSNSVGASKVEVCLEQDRTISQLDCYGAVAIEACTLDSIDLELIGPNGLTNYGELELWDYGRDLDIRGNLQNMGYIVLEELDILGILHNTAEGKIEIAYAVDVKPNFVNEGWIFVPDHGDFITEGGALINKGKMQIKDGLVVSWESDADFRNEPNGVIWGSGSVYSEQRLINSGLISASSGKLVVLSQEEIVNNEGGTLESKAGSPLHIETGVSDFNNLGEIRVNANGAVTVKFEKLFSEPNDCTLNNEPNGAIILNGGTLAAGTITQEAGATLEGFGTIASDLLIAPGGSVSIAGPTNIVGDVVVGTGATLAISDGTTLITGHCTCNNGTISISRATPIAQGGFTNNGCSIITKVGTDKKRSDFNLDGRVNFGDLAYLAYTWLSRAEL